MLVEQDDLVGAAAQPGRLERQRPVLGAGGLLGHRVVASARARAPRARPAPVRVEDDGEAAADRQAARLGRDERRRLAGPDARRSRRRRGGRSGTARRRCRRPGRRARRRSRSRPPGPGPAASTQSMRSCTSFGIGLEPARRPREPGHGDRVGMHLAVGVAEARVRERVAHRPVERERHVGADGADRRRPVEVRRRVEVPGQEDGDPPRGQLGQDGELLLDRRQPDRALELVQLLRGAAVPHEVRAVRLGGEVRVPDGDHLCPAPARRRRTGRCRTADRSAGSAR